MDPEKEARSVHIKCICGHHETDTITLRERLPFRTALKIRAQTAVVMDDDPDAGVADILAALTEAYVLDGIESWTLTDADGKPLAPSKANIREKLLTNFEQAWDVAEKADDMYQEQVIVPLVAMGQRSLPPGSTGESISPTIESSTELPTPSSPSLISTIPTDDIETTSTSPDGDSNTLPRLASVG
jgi:hypothetical protein